MQYEKMEKDEVINQKTQYLSSIELRIWSVWYSGYNFTSSIFILSSYWSSPRETVMVALTHSANINFMCSFQVNQKPI